ncbi:hypothetical protein GF340_01955, partial [Candidatus Peregrinibacteria bacterium]|nr:hypothetical protein [Candidatus Peregrinibacteria bacterium]
MPEKQAKGFGYGEKDATFQLKSQSDNSDQGKPKEKQILLNIASKSGDKILIRKKQGSVQLTGNPIIDTFNKLNDWVIQQSKVKVKDKAVFFRLLAVMLNAGLPLIKSLDTLGVQFEKSPKLAKILFAMAREIEKGASLSDAMGEYNDVFNDAEIGVVRAGEASGQMNKTLKSLALDVEKSASIAGKVKGAMIYPIVIMSLLVVAIFLMMTMVVPQITRLFTQTGEQLPLPTRILIAVSEFSVAYWPVVIGGVVLAIFLFGVFRKTRQGRFLLHQFAISVPIFGPLIRKTALSKFARGFSNMLGSG